MPLHGETTDFAYQCLHIFDDIVGRAHATSQEFLQSLLTVVPIERRRPPSPGLPRITSAAVSTWPHGFGFCNCESGGLCSGRHPAGYALLRDKCSRQQSVFEPSNAASTVQLHMPAPVSVRRLQAAQASLHNNGSSKQNPIARKIPASISPPHSETQLDCESDNGKTRIEWLLQDRNGLLAHIMRARLPHVCDVLSRSVSAAQPLSTHVASELPRPVHGRDRDGWWVNSGLLARGCFKQHCIWD